MWFFNKFLLFLLKYDRKPMHHPIMNIAGTNFINKDNQYNMNDIIRISIYHHPSQSVKNNNDFIIGNWHGAGEIIK